MIGTAGRRGRWRAAGVAVAIGALELTGWVEAARADNGVLGFFQQVFGSGESRSSNLPLPQPEGAGGESPPLTVRMHKHRRPSGAQVARAQRYSPEELKSVTIYTDKTLARGDAVMTARGLRIFNGSPAAWPHTDSDFVVLSAADRVGKTVRKELTAIDVASRSDFRGE